MQTCIQPPPSALNPPTFIFHPDVCTLTKDLVDAGFTDAFAYAVLHKIDGRAAAVSYVLDRNNM
jgi:hypothetical protein